MAEQEYLYQMRIKRQLRDEQLVRSHDFLLSGSHGVRTKDALDSRCCEPTLRNREKQESVPIFDVISRPAISPVKSPRQITFNNGLRASAVLEICPGEIEIKDGG